MKYAFYNLPTNPRPYAVLIVNDIFEFANDVLEPIAEALGCAIYERVKP